ncbi:MAG: hypothetical protein LUF87_02170 [Alistipes sp.]|nr:hypothetical protein [Alistipes sp.]
MNYDNHEQDTLMVEENTPFDADALHDDYMASQGNMTKISLSDFKSTENLGAFNTLKEEMEWGTSIDPEFIINKNCPYYKFFSVSASETKNLHLNKDILNYIYNHFENYILDTHIPSNFVGATNAKETYLFHLLKRDSQNSKLTHDPETGYKATYNRITINYGKLPYTTEELDAKLNSLL